MDDKQAVSKNNDCYFYYYSSCSKGEACPFRHEPAALRNETVCIFWMQGNCNKANCIFRHMEITKRRDKMPCWFESRPGGCKKPHCPFQHQNILDHPREEDIKKKPDLILPVRKDEAGKEEKEVISDENGDRQVVLPKNETGSLTPPRQAYFSQIPRDPIIVPLQDGESDSESVSGSPYKRGNPELSAQLEWELRKLRQIQADEADIIGYVFADDEEGEEEREEEEVEEVRYENESMNPNQEVEEEYVVEEILEVEEEPDAAHRRLHPVQHNSYQETQVMHVPNKARGMLAHPQVTDPHVKRRVQISERLGGVASRALAETLGTNVQLRKSPVKRLSSNRREPDVNVNMKTIGDRLGQRPVKRTGIADRLGALNSKESLKIIQPQETNSGPAEGMIASRITALRNLNMPSDEMKSASDSQASQAGGVSKSKEINLNFTVKSLTDIRAQRQRTVTVKKMSPNGGMKTIHSRLGAKNGTNVRLEGHKKIEVSKDESNVNILSLSEIKAKQRSSGKRNSAITKPARKPISLITFSEEDVEKPPSKTSSTAHLKKRAISPVSFNNTNKRSAPKNSNDDGQRKKRCRSPISFMKDNTSKHKKISISFDSSSKTTEDSVPPLGARKITIKKSPVKLAQEPLDEIVRSDKKVLVTNNNLKLKVNSNVSKVANVSNNVPLNAVKVPSDSSKHPPSTIKPGSVKDSTDKLLNNSISKQDSFIDEEEALLLGGDFMDDLDEDIDEAALLL